MFLPSTKDVRTRPVPDLHASARSLMGFEHLSSLVPMSLLHVLGNFSKYRLLKPFSFVALGVLSVVIEVLECYKVAE